MNFSLKVIQLKKYVVNFFKYRVFEKYCSIFKQLSCTSDKIIIFKFQNPIKCIIHYFGQIPLFLLVDKL